MLSQNSRLRAMKSLLYSYYTDFTTFYGIYLGIITGLCLTKFIFSSSASGSSALTVGMVNCFILLPIAMAAITSNSELLKKFSFPVDRDLVALSHIMLILLLPLIMLLTSCIFYLLEILASELLMATSDNFFYSWLVTRGSFLAGFAVSYIVIVAVTALSWMFFAWFYRYKVIVSVVTGTFALALIYFSEFREAFLSLVGKVFVNPSPGLLSLKLGTITLVLFALGYIPIKRMEVK